MEKQEITFFGRVFGGENFEPITQSSDRDIELSCFGSEKFLFGFPQCFNIFEVFQLKKLRKEKSEIGKKNKNTISKQTESRNPVENAFFA